MSKNDDSANDNEADKRAEVSTKLADFASELLKHSETFSAASREIRSFSGVRLSARVLDLATKIGATTEELHNFRRYLQALVRKKTLPL